MQISNLPASNSFSSTDVLPIEINGVTYKVTGATLAAALHTLGNYLTTENVANNLTTAAAGSVLDARQGKALADSIGIVETGTTCTHTGGIAAGQYVIWQGVLYTADAAISVGETLAASGGGKNLTACSDGGLNKLMNDLLNPTTSDITFSSTTYYKIMSGSYFKCVICGKLVTINGNISCVTPYSSYPGALCVSGLPIPAGETINIDPLNIAGKRIRVRLDTSGELYFRGGEASQDYNVLITYIMA
jgi:hypothetical protein